MPAISSQPPRLAALYWGLLAVSVSFTGCQHALLNSRTALRGETEARPSSQSICVVGIMGSIVSHNDPRRSEYKIAGRLRVDYPTGMNVQLFENRHRSAAHTAILAFLDTNHDGVLSEEEKRSAHIILFGHSWGGSAIVQLAHRLEKENIRVLLTVQVDSIAKPGQHDTVIPANVARAANFYQSNGILHGTPEIRAADAAHTTIIGNYRYDYKQNPVKCSEYPWYERKFFSTHTQIACDPSVWSQVELLIREELPSSAQK